MLQIPPIKLTVSVPDIRVFWLFRIPSMDTTWGVVDGTRGVPMVSVTVLVGLSYVAAVTLWKVLKE